MAVSSETKVGVLAVIAVTALVLGFDFLKGNQTFNRGRTFYVVYEQVPGLKKSNPIMVNDLLVGRVKELTLRDDYTILARLSITEDFPIPADTRAMISASDFLGAKQVDLVIGKDDMLARNRDTLNGTIEVGIQDEIREVLKPITGKMQGLIAQIDSAVTVVSAIFSGETGDDVESSLTSISASLENFRSMTDRVDRMVGEQANSVDSIFGNLEAVTGAFAQNKDQLDRILDNLASITDTLAAVEFAGAISDARTAIQGLTGVLESVNNGKGTLGKLIVDETLYDNLNASSQDLDALLRDIEANPGRYVTLFRIGGGGKKRDK